MSHRTVRKSPSGRLDDTPVLSRLFFFNHGGSDPMRTEISAAQASGRVVEHVAMSENESDQCLITFSDDTFTTIVVLNDRPVAGKLHVLSFGDAQLVQLGIISVDELEQLRSQHLRQREEQRQKAEVAEYKRLRDKYGDSPQRELLRESVERRQSRGQTIPEGVELFLSRSP